MIYDCLIVDDEEALSQSTLEYFELFGIKTAWVTDMDTCISFLGVNSVQVILLDINLGSDSGFTLCKKLRENYDVPILFISARNSDDDVLLALGIGGDDYISKPYSLSVLLAKVKTVLKRYQNTSRKDINPVNLPLQDNVFTFGSFCVNFDQDRVFENGEDLRFKSMEYKLLVYLIQNRNKTISKDELFHHVWEDSITGDNTLNVHIRRLREKIEKDPNNPVYIKTIWGTGYRFEGSET